MGVNTKKKPPGGDVLAIGKNTATLQIDEACHAVKKLVAMLVNH